MIKAIAFDYGGVISLSQKNLIPEIRSILEVSKEEWSSMYFSLNHLCNTGTNTWEDVLLLTSEKLGAKEDQKNKIRLLISEEMNTKIINQNLIEKITVLKKDTKIALISNYSTGLRDLLARQKIINLFDEIIISSEVGVQKPDPAIFYILCDRLSIKPSEFVFIDDTEKSLESAKDVGYKPILFKNNEQLFLDLEKLLEEQ